MLWMGARPRGQRRLLCLLSGCLHGGWGPVPVRVPLPPHLHQHSFFSFSNFRGGRPGGSRRRPCSSDMRPLRAQSRRASVPCPSAACPPSLGRCLLRPLAQVVVVLSVMFCPVLCHGCPLKHASTVDKVLCVWFAAVAPAVGVVSKGPFANQRPVSFSRTVTGFTLTFRLLVHWALVSVCGVGRGSHVTLLCIHTQLSQRHLLERLFFLH